MKNVGIVDKNDEIEEGNELILELSIGGIFSKPARESQAHRRRELRRKREEKLKKSVGFSSCGSFSGPFVENEVWLESEIIRQNGDVLEIEPVRKKEKIGNGNSPENNGFVNPNGGQAVVGIDEDENTKNSVFRQKVCRNFKPFQGNMNLKRNEDEIDGGGRRNPMVNSNGSGGGGSSAYSDGQCSSHRGGATDDSRSNSSNYQLDQQPTTTSTASDPSDQPTGSSKQTVSTTKLTKLTDSSSSEPSLVKPNDKLNPHESSVLNPPPMLDTSRQQQQASFLARMPCVSTTGNGPNGKTVSGFLYRYTKNEVSIVCVCHGQSFSPAGFVEHASGVDIAYPLKHITIFPTAFAS